MCVYMRVCVLDEWRNFSESHSPLRVDSLGVEEEASGRLSKGHRRLLCSADGSATPLRFVFLKSLTQRKKEKPGSLCADLLYFSLGGTLIKVMPVEDTLAWLSLDC